MLDPVLNIIKKLFVMLGRGVKFLFALLLRPFGFTVNWWRERGWIVKTVFGGLLLFLVLFYGYFLYATQVWTNFNPNYPDAYHFADRKASAGATLPLKPGETTAGCQPSAIVQVTGDLADFTINQNAWVSSMLAYKLGLFGVDWDDTPFMDNKASFQRGINAAVRKTTTELVDYLGRVRATSRIDTNLQTAREWFQQSERTWYIGSTPPYLQPSTPSRFRKGLAALRAFNDDLAACKANFDTRADNLAQYVDRIVADLGSTSDLLKAQARSGKGGWFDFRADDRFWLAYGQLYAYYGLLKATEVDFQDVIQQRQLTLLWRKLDAQFVAALQMQPMIVANGREDGWLVPSHLTAQGFHLLGISSNLVEIRSVLSR